MKASVEGEGGAVFVISMRSVSSETVMRKYESIGGGGMGSAVLDGSMRSVLSEVVMIKYESIGGTTIFSVAYGSVGPLSLRNKYAHASARK